MLQYLKRGFALCLALVMIIGVLPAIAYADEEEPTCTPVQSKLDFTTLPRIAEGGTDERNQENKKKVTDAVLAAGAFECENLYLAGNFETIVNPGGYQGWGHFTHKLSAVEGETIQNATMNLGYYICEGDQPGYVQVMVSHDNENWNLVFEDREPNGAPFYNTRKTVSLELPFEEGKTDLYVRVDLQHYSTYEGAGVAYSEVYINTLERPVDSEKPAHQCQMVTQTHSFNNLAQGEVSAEEIGAVEETNMYFGIDGVTLLSPRNGYENASAVWMLEAAEGEPLHDAVLTIVGRTWWQAESVKNDNFLKVYASIDGVSYQLVHDFRATDNPDDTQRFTVDLTQVANGYGKIYVKLEWLVFDSPHIFGIRSVTLTGNTAGVDSSGGSTRIPVSNAQSFTQLPVGPVDTSTLGAFKSANLMFGYNKTPLLTPSEAGEDAYVTWKLNAAEGETFTDCYLLLVGRFSYINADKKDSTVLTVHFSPDGEKYTKVKEIKPTEKQEDDNLVVVDLSAQAYDLSEVYVRVYWSSQDDPAGMGLRGMALLGNVGLNYEEYLPEMEDRVITDGEMPSDPNAPTNPADPSAPGDDNVPGGNTPAPKDNTVVWVIVAVAVVAVIVVVCIVLKKKKISDGK